MLLLYNMAANTSSQFDDIFDGDTEEDEPNKFSNVPIALKRSANDMSAGRG